MRRREDKLMREPTADELASFRKACALLKALTKKGFQIYLASDTFHLMRGPSHRTEPGACVAQQQNSVDSCTVPGSGGGDW